MRTLALSILVISLVACGKDNKATPDAGGSCTDGILNGDETDVDCGGSCSRDGHKCADTKSCTGASDCESSICDHGACQVPACGDGIMQAGEMCDDGNSTLGDGCDDGPMGNCRPTGCGNGAMDPTEECDDGNAVNGDGCDNNCKMTGCGNGVITGVEACDDGNAINGDGCNTACMKEPGFDCAGTTVSVCTPICGDGLVVGSESCDDMNATPGDGCDMCQIDLGCGVGETKVVMTKATQTPIPDDGVTELTQTLTLPAGGVTKLAVVANLTHTYDGDLDLSLEGPTGLTRFLSLSNGGSGDNYEHTIFDDAAATLIDDGSAPFSGSFRPDDSLATTPGSDFRSTNAVGTWTFHVIDNSSGDTGTLNSWTLFACVNPTMYCGNSVVDAGEECDDGNMVDTDACSNSCQIVDGCGDGNIDSGEECDDNNLVSGDGCSSTCHLEITCPTGSTKVTVASTTAFPIPDDNTAGVSSPIAIATAGAITGMYVRIDNLTHTADVELALSLIGPNGVARALATNVGSGANFVGTTFRDGAAVPIGDGSGPFTNLYAPERSLASAAHIDFLGAAAKGTWNLHVVDTGATETGTLTGWTLIACVDPALSFCGDGTKNVGEACDDGNFNNADTCTNTCHKPTGCGDGIVEAGEQCDDGNLDANDGCSATCQLDCPVGSALKTVTNATSIAIPDHDATGVSSPVTVSGAGTVKAVFVIINGITHTFDRDLGIFLAGPTGVKRELSTHNGSSDDNYTNTLFSDRASLSIVDGVAPFTGEFKPETSLSATAGTDFLNTTAAGVWNLEVADTASSDTGTLDSWTLAVCVAP